MSSAINTLVKIITYLNKCIYINKLFIWINTEFNCLSEISAEKPSEKFQNPVGVKYISHGIISFLKK